MIVGLLKKITDIYLIVCGEHFGMDVSLFADAAIEHQIDLSNFPLFKSRIKGRQVRNDIAALPLRRRLNDILITHGGAVG